MNDQNTNYLQDSKPDWLPPLELAKRITMRPIPKDLSRFRCLGYLDKGWYIEPPQIVGKYPKDTKLSQMTILVPTVEVCPCQRIKT
jgi:hypothetical protein